MNQHILKAYGNDHVNHR